MGRKQTESAGWPAFDSPLLQEITAAFLRRRKAIAYRLRAEGGVACARDFSESASGTQEVVALAFGQRIQFCVWDGGDLWLSVRIKAVGRNSGWAFQDHFYGDSQDVSGAALVRMVEATLALRFGSDFLTERDRLRCVWRRVMLDNDRSPLDNGESRS